MYLGAHFYVLFVLAVFIPRESSLNDLLEQTEPQCQ